MLGVAPGIMAQSGDVSVKLNKAELKGNALNLDADVRIGPLHVGRYSSVSLTLVLKGTGKGESLSLPPVIVNGANKLQMYKRAVALYGEKGAKKGAYAMLKNDPELIQFHPYKRAVAYKPWMNNCQLILVREVKDYHDKTVQSSSVVLSRRLAIQGSSSATGRQPNTTTGTPNRSQTYSLPPATNPNNRTTNSPAVRRPATTTRPASTTNTRPANTTTNTPANRRPNTTNNNPRR
jgi:hypothetical protein